jgi:hypothetical protein
LVYEGDTGDHFAVYRNPGSRFDDNNISDSNIRSTDFARTPLAAYRPPAPVVSAVIAKCAFLSRKVLKHM